MEIDLVVEVAERLGYWVDEDTDSEGETVYMLVNNDGHAGRKWRDTEDEAWRDAGSFDSDLNAAFELVTAENIKGIDLHLEYNNGIVASAHAQLHIDIRKTVHGWGETAAEAICRAWIAYHEGEQA